MLLFCLFPPLYVYIATSIAANVYYESALPSTPIHLWNTDCFGDENEILECFYDTLPSCEHSEDVGIICSIPQSGSHMWVGPQLSASVVDHVYVCVSVYIPTCTKYHIVVDVFRHVCYL